jgi:RNA polymerase primary sigma factor
MTIEAIVATKEACHCGKELLNDVNTLRERAERLQSVMQQIVQALRHVCGPTEEELKRVWSIVMGPDGTTQVDIDLLTRERERELLELFCPLRDEKNRQVRRRDDLLCATSNKEKEIKQCQEKIEDLTRKMQPYVDELTYANQRLIAHICKRFRYSGLKLKDLQQIGNIGLLTALKRFDLSRNCRFATYATWWIRQQLQCGSAEEAPGRIMVLSPHSIAELSSINRVQHEWEEKGLGVPTAADISRETGLSISVTEGLLRAKSFRSFSAPMDDGGEEIGTALSEDGTLIFNANQASHSSGQHDLDPEVESHDRKEFLGTLFEHLRPREKELLELRYGLDGQGGRSLRQIGTILRISKERVRQLESRALGKLRTAGGAEVASLIDRNQTTEEDDDNETF